MNKKIDKQKTPRAALSREKATQRKPWAPPSQLDAPPAPEGYKHRWLRTETLGQDDTKNMSARLREGFELVRADEYPEGQYPSVATGKHVGVIGVGGLVLARIPIEIVKEREAYFAQLAKDKDEAIENELFKEEHPSMPISKPERQSRVTFGGKKV